MFYYQKGTKFELELRGLYIVALIIAFIAVKLTER